jgi:phosphatidylglycerophosphate synthase
MLTRLRKQHIPWIMAAARAALGPVLILGAACRWNGIALACLIVAALLSDIFDGVLARRWQCDTAGVRLFDSMADTVFYVGAAVALWIARPDAIHAHATLLKILVALEAARLAFDVAKFGKPASYHSYLAKGWGLVLAVAVVAAFATTGAGILMVVALMLGIVCDLEGFAMSLVLPRWHRDVNTLGAAWRLRLRASALSGSDLHG